MSALLRSILTEPWALTPEAAYSYMPSVANFLLGKEFGTDLGNSQYIEPKSFGEDHKPVRQSENPYLLPSAASKMVDAWDMTLEEWGYKEIPEGSTFVLQVRGTILKYNQSCGPAGITTHHAWLNKAIAHKNISHIVMVVDGPGGQATYTDVFADAIGKSPKPVNVFVEGMAASASYWLASAGANLYLSSANDQVGSIGTMVFFADYKQMLEEQGVKFHEFYATLSTDKNALFNKVLKGDYTEYIKNQLDPLNESFHNAVKANRPNISPDVFTGKMYRAEEAVALGMADGIKTFSEFIDIVQNTSSNTNSNMGLFGSKNPKAQAALKASLNGGEPSAEILAEANAELEGQETNLRMVSAEDLEVATNNANALATAQETITALTAERDAALASQATAEQQAKEAKAATAQVQSDFDAFLEKTPGAAHTAVVEDPKAETKKWQGAEYSSDVNAEVDDMLNSLKIAK